MGVGTSAVSNVQFLPFPPKRSIKFEELAEVKTPAFLQQPNPTLTSTSPPYFSFLLLNP